MTLPPHSVKIFSHQWGTDSRPCDFSLCLQTPRGAVFADFDWDAEERIFLRRISFDGYGCCTTNGQCSKLPLEESKLLANVLAEDDLNQRIVFEVLSRYFSDNDLVVWRDALLAHQLIH